MALVNETGVCRAAYWGSGLAVGRCCERASGATCVGGSHGRGGWVPRGLVSHQELEVDRPGEKWVDAPGDDLGSSGWARRMPQAAGE